MPYRTPQPVGQALEDLSYAQFRAIRFRSEEATWRGTAPFELQFFHPGGGFAYGVEIHVVEDGQARAVAFDPSLFSYGSELDDVDLTLPSHAGFAGFRILHPLNASNRMDEVVSFLGASYFRLLGPGQVYGLSSRGVAVDVAEPGGEEFPDFTSFWLVRPEAEARSLEFYALLDGPSITGAFRFELTPGSSAPPVREPDTNPRTAPRTTGTVLAVEARLFAREDVARLGVAPLTSMYLHGTFRLGGEDDVRPRVHDSEGLLMETSGGEWIWRPLTNRAGVKVTSLRDRTPRGFGLVQRDRDFGSYLDLEAAYHRRPSQWVAIEGNWGEGGVQLVELPSTSEFEDNIVAYWAPDGVFARGESRTYRYRLVTFDERLLGGEAPGGPVRGQALAQVVRTRIGWDALPGQVPPPPRSRRRVVVDFAGGELDSLVPEREVEAVLQLSAGEARGLRVETLPSGGRRATFSLQPDSDRPSDMRLHLRVAETVLTETWSYLLEPSREP